MAAKKAGTAGDEDSRGSQLKAAHGIVYRRLSVLARAATFSG
jgi:hypothetical protein